MGKRWLKCECVYCSTSGCCKSCFASLYVEFLICWFLVFWNSWQRVVIMCESEGEVMEFVNCKVELIFVHKYRDRHVCLLPWILHCSFARCIYVVGKVSDGYHLGEVRGNVWLIDSFARLIDRIFSSFSFLLFWYLHYFRLLSFFLFL